MINHLNDERKLESQQLRIKAKRTATDISARHIITTKIFPGLSGRHQRGKCSHYITNFSCLYLFGTLPTRAPERT
jgi:hypothetical protein